MEAEEKWLRGELYYNTGAGGGYDSVIKNRVKHMVCNTFYGGG